MSNNCFPANATHNKKWRVLYTRSNWEKKADALLKQSGLNSFCPIIKQKRKWADRSKIVEVPLFSSYVFVQVNSIEEDRVLQTSGVIGYVRDFGTIAEISAAEIELIKSSVNTYEDIECVNIRELIKGNSVSLNEGVLYDLKGEVLEVQGKQVILLMKGLECGLVAKVKVSSGSIHLTKKLTN
jgi:transcription antitermination factor NusG